MRIVVTFFFVMIAIWSYGQSSEVPTPAKTIRYIKNTLESIEANDPYQGKGNKMTYALSGANGTTVYPTSTFKLTKNSVTKKRYSDTNPIIEDRLKSDIFFKFSDISRVNIQTDEKATFLSIDFGKEKVKSIHTSQYVDRYKYVGNKYKDEVSQPSVSQDSKSYETIRIYGASDTLRKLRNAIEHYMTYSKIEAEKVQKEKEKDPFDY